MKNGFTLIELIAVIALLGVLGVVITISVSNNISKNKENECNNFIKEIETAACVYESTHECDSDICEGYLQVKKICVQIVKMTLLIMGKE